MSWAIVGAAVAAAGLAGMVGGYIAARVRYGMQAAAAYEKGVCQGIEVAREVEEMPSPPQYDRPVQSVVTIH